MKIITITRDILTFLFNIYQSYVGKINYGTAIIALIVIISVSLLVDTSKFKKNNGKLELIENSFLFTALILLLNISLVFNLGKVLPQYLLGLQTFYFLMIGIIIKQMLVTILRNIVLQDHSIMKDAIFIISIVCISLAVKVNYIIPFIISVIFITTIHSADSIKKLITKLLISKYGLLYVEDEYIKAMSKVNIEK